MERSEATVGAVVRRRALAAAVARASPASATAGVNPPADCRGTTDRQEHARAEDSGQDDGKGSRHTRKDQQPETGCSKATLAAPQRHLPHPPHTTVHTARTNPSLSTETSPPRSNNNASSHADTASPHIDGPCAPRDAHDDDDGKGGLNAEHTATQARRAGAEATGHPCGHLAAHDALPRPTPCSSSSEQRLDADDVAHADTRVHAATHAHAEAVAAAHVRPAREPQGPHAIHQVHAGRGGHAQAALAELPRLAAPGPQHCRAVAHPQLVCARPSARGCHRLEQAPAVVAGPPRHRPQACQAVCQACRA